jgi:hypothetical protein
MKKIFLFLFIQINVIIATAQSQSDSDYSFGIKAFSIEELSKLMNEVKLKSSYQTFQFNGLVFKVNDNQISYRFQINTLKKDDYSFKNECITCETVTGKFDELNLRIGFERNITYTRLQPFYGIDLGYKTGKFNGEALDSKTNLFLYNVSIQKNGATVYPFIGVKFNIIKSLTLSAESGIDFLYNYEKEIKSTKNNVVTSSNGFKRSRFINKPLGMLSLQYNFGSNQ